MVAYCRSKALQNVRSILQYFDMYLAIIGLENKISVFLSVVVQYVKSAGQETSGVSSIIFESHIHSRASALNIQFEAVFAKEDSSSISDKGSNPY